MIILGCKSALLCFRQRLYPDHAFKRRCNRLQMKWSTLKISQLSLGISLIATQWCLKYVMFVWSFKNSHAQKHFLYRCFIQSAKRHVFSHYLPLLGRAIWAHWYGGIRRWCKGPLLFSKENEYTRDGSSISSIFLHALLVVKKKHSLFHYSHNTQYSPENPLCSFFDCF